MGNIKSYYFLVTACIYISFFMGTISSASFSIADADLFHGQVDKELVIEFYGHPIDQDLISQLKVNGINFHLSGDAKIYYGEIHFIEVYRIFSSILDSKYPSVQYSWRDEEKLNRFISILKNKKIPFVLFETISAGSTIYSPKKYSEVVSNIVKMFREEEKNEFLRKFWGNSTQ